MVYVDIRCGSGGGGHISVYMHIRPNLGLLSVHFETTSDQIYLIVFLHILSKYFF